MYGAFWCSHCFSQKQLFGKEVETKFPYVECYPDGWQRVRACIHSGTPLEEGDHGELRLAGWLAEHVQNASGKVTHCVAQGARTVVKVVNKQGAIHPSGDVRSLLKRCIMCTHCAVKNQNQDQDLQGPDQPRPIAVVKYARYVQYLKILHIVVAVVVVVWFVYMVAPSVVGPPLTHWNYDFDGESKDWERLHPRVKLKVGEARNPCLTDRDGSLCK